VQGTTTAAFGDGINVTGAVQVVDSTHATIPILIDPLAVNGGRTVTVVTGGEYAVATNGFTITSNGSSLASISSTSGAQGNNATITLTGLGTHWETAATNVSLGAGINVGNITVNNSHSLSANISIGPGAAVGPRTVTVTTNGEIVSLSSAFNVTAATPYLSNVTPTSGQQGQQNLNVVITGVYTTFAAGPLSANFGPNITVNSVIANSDTSATANISIANTAATDDYQRQSGLRSSRRERRPAGDGQQYPLGAGIDIRIARLLDYCKSRDREQPHHGRSGYHDRGKCIPGRPRACDDHGRRDCHACWRFHCFALHADALGFAIIRNDRHDGEREFQR
jgi:hypothetical protein